MAPNNSTYQVAEEGEYIRIIRGRNNGKVVKVHKVGIAKVTFKEGLWNNRFVSHGEYEVIRATTPMAPNDHEDDKHENTTIGNKRLDKNNKTVNMTTLTDFHSEGIATIVAARSNDNDDVDNAIEEIIENIRVMALEQIRIRNIN